MHNSMPYPVKQNAYENAMHRCKNRMWEVRMTLENKRSIHDDEPDKILYPDD